MSELPKASRAAPGNDNRAASPRPEAPSGLAADFVMAMRFYSLLPMQQTEHEVPDINRIARAAPFASLIIAGVPAIVLFCGWFLGLPVLFSALLSAGVGAALTGAMAEDAIGDAMDGLGGRTPERRLEILRDSRIGAYGVLGIMLFVGLKTLALADLLETKAVGAVLLFLAAEVVSRSAALYLAHALPPARTDGASATAGRLMRWPFLTGIGFAGLIGMLLAAPFVGLVGVGLAYLLSALACLGWTALWRHLIGGQTGDLIGGLQAVLEIVVLTSFILLAGGPR
ncbi:MAG: adenosylcobinamide-GDP ribazoletransferase [Alphaproteobacteria bacterium]|nr:adenosylcobinamide-GDP ribazoletransferase [Alphaproteobacteria bacterium]